MDGLIETRHVAAVDYRDITAAGQHDDCNRWLFLPQTSGGSTSLPSRAVGQPSNQLYWHLHNHTTSTLTLAEVSLSIGQIGRGVRLHIPGQVFSALACDASAGDACYLFLLLSSRSVGVLRLPTPSQQQQQRPVSGGSSSGSILDALHAHSLLQLHLPQQLAQLGVPTAMGAANGHLCIAGSSGGVTCLPLGALTAGQLPAQGSVLQLNPSNLIVQMRRRMGFAASSSVVAVLPVRIPAAGAAAGSQQKESLLVVHEDGSCHQWLVSSGRQGLSHSLAGDAAARQLRPNRVLLCYPGESTRRSGSSSSSSTPAAAAAWDVLLVWDLSLADGGGQSDMRVLPLRLQAGPAAAAGGARLEPLLQQPQQLQLEWPDASLLDARVEGQQLLLLISTKAGASHVVAYSLRDWAYQGRCQLLQQCVSAEWSLKEELWCCALAAANPGSGSSGSAAAAAAATQVLSQLLVPGQLCLPSLVAALAYHGAQMGEAEAAGASLGHLQARISAAVELIKAKFPTYSPARCWHALFASYCEAWQQQHGLLGLLSAPGGWIGTVRAGGLLYVLRRPCPAEVLLAESSQKALGDVLQAAGAAGSRDGRPIPGGAAELAKVRLCLSMLGELLGQPALRVMTQAVMAGVSVEGELLPRFLELLLQGPPVAAAAAGGGGADVQARLSEWRLQRQAQLLAVQEQLAELPYPLETLGGVVDLVIKTATAAAAQLQAPAAAAANPGDLNPGAQIGSLLSSIALHSARTSCMALQLLLLLLGCICQLGRVGATQLTAADQAAISQDEVPRLATALRSAAVALWLCKTPASTQVAGSGGAGASGGSGLNPGSVLGPLLGLRNPTPSGTPAGTPRSGEDELGAATPVAVGGGAAGGAFGGGGGLGGAQGVQAAAPAWQHPLAAHLLPLFWKQQGPLQQQQAGAQLGTLGSQLAVWLMLGAGAEAAAAATGAGHAAAFARIGGRTDAAAGSSSAAAVAAVTSPQGLAGSAVLLGYQLFVCREYEAMRRLVQLIGGREPAEAGLQFLLGLSIACGIKKQPGSGSSVGGGSGSVQLDSAVGHLFRAAAGLTGEEAAPLRLVLQLLRQRQGSGGSTAAAAAPSDMETDGGKAAAGADGAAADAGTLQREAKLRLQFCQAIVLLFEREGVTQGALAFARAALGAVDATYTPAQQQEKVQQQAALWTSVFNFAAELDLSHDAYTAALSNPLPERAAESVRRLVQTLVDRGQLQQLLALPWSGVLLLTRNGLQEPVPVVELVVDKLTRRALHSELSVQPCSHQVLFDFLVAWGNYKAAAAAMLSYARRLRAAAAVGKQRRGASVQQTVEEVVAAYAASTAMLQLFAPADAWLDPDQPLLAPFPAPPPRIASSSASSGTGLESLASMAQQLPVITVQDLQQEAALFGASALLLQQLLGLEVMQYGLSGEYILEQLLGAQHFAEAVQLAHTLWGTPERAGQLAEKLESISFALAGACVKLQQSQGPTDSFSYSLQEDGLMGGAGSAGSGGTEGSTAAGVLSRWFMSYTGPGHLGSEGAAAWQKLRELLELYDAAGGTGSTGSGGAGSTVGGVNGSAGDVVGSSSLGGRLRLAAVDGALAEQPGLQLPAWLLQPFQPALGAAGGMAGAAADPAALMRVYIRHGRLLDAAQLAKDHLEVWQRQGALLRAQPGVVWLPLQGLELLHASLVAGAARSGAAQQTRDAEVLGAWSEVLEAGIADHLALVRSDAGKLGAAAPAAGGGGAGGGAMGMGLVF